MVSNDPTQPTPPTHPGGARWCDDHAMWECTKQRSRGRGECHGPAITGTNACRMHIGVPVAVARSQAQAAQAITAFQVLTGVPSLDPGRAVLGMLQMSWLRVHLYAGLLEDQVQTAREAAELNGGGFTDGAAEDQPAAEGVAGLIGYTFAADKQAGIFAAGEAQRALVQLEAQERDRCVRYAKTAHDMGIAEREVRLAEQQGQLLASVIRNVLGDLDLSEEQQERVPRVVQARLLEVTQLEATGGAA